MAPSREEIHQHLYQRYLRRISAVKATREINSFYGSTIVKERTAQWWFQKFRKGDTRLTRKRGSGRPRKVNRQTLRRRLQQNPEGSTRILAQDYCGRMTVWRWLKKTGRKWLKQRQIPYQLNNSIKDQRARSCRQLLNEYRCGRLPLCNIVTHDQSWIFYDGRVLKRQWLGKGRLGKVVPKRNIHGNKRLLCVYWCSSGILFWELLQKGQTFKSNVYRRHMQQVEQKILRLLYQNEWNGPVFVLEDNASSHKSSKSKNFMKNNLHWNVLSHPPYSPDIAPSDYYLFLSLKDFLRGKQFNNQGDLEDELEDYFHSRQPDFYKRGLEKLPKRWLNVYNNHGKYIV